MACTERVPPNLRVREIPSDFAAGFAKKWLVCKSRCVLPRGRTGFYDYHQRKSSSYGIILCRESWSRFTPFWVTRNLKGSTKWRGRYSCTLLTPYSITNMSRFRYRTPSINRFVLFVLRRMGLGYEGNEVRFSLEIWRWWKFFTWYQVLI